MDVDDFRSILERLGVDVWCLIDTAINVAALDFRSELKQRRDGIVEKLYSAPNSFGNSDYVTTSDGEHETKASVEKESKGKEGERVGSASPSTPLSVDGEDEFEPFAGIFEDEQKKIFEIKEQLEDPDQPEEGVVDLLQTLADMDITFQALKETDIGRHVNRLRKHSSSDVRRLVKQLVRKWKEIVDEWVRMNPLGEHASPAHIADGDSPLQKNPWNGCHQVPDFAYSPNPHNGSSGSDKNTSEPEQKPKPVPRKEPPPKPMQRSAPASVSAPPSNVQKQREPQKESNFDSERLASASKRLQANYKEAENAKKQRTIQVMGIHELPKPKNKNTFFGKNRSSGSQRRHW